MTLSLLILRPIEGAKETAQRAQNMGLDAIVDPLFVIEPMAWTAPPASDFDAIMVTSANGVQYAGANLSQYQQLPLLAVGEATAATARDAGFDVTETGSGGADELLQSLPAGRYSRILRLTGKDHVKLTPSGQEITLCRVYQARALSLGEKAQAALRQGHVILLYSVRAATILADEMDRLGLDRSINQIAALSPNIAKAAGGGWKSVHSADRPTDDALLSLAGRLCLP
ncbi:MAG: uroporphyrinogen-III synthase [Parasphingorhabdus sp.]|uniref:uroporphyrinogen-III synthase n=1 Tax=Parasphingorhabdus sp. TaxID=2709688 RepID=UPI0032995EEE